MRCSHMLTGLAALGIFAMPLAGAQPAPPGVPAGGPVDAGVVQQGDTPASGPPAAAPGTFDSERYPIDMVEPTGRGLSPRENIVSPEGAGPHRAAADQATPAHRAAPRTEEIPRGTVTLSGEVVRRAQRLPDGTRIMRSFLRIEEAKDSAGRLVSPLAGASVEITGDNARDAIRYDGEEVRVTGELRNKDITREARNRYELDLRDIQSARVEVSELRYR